MTTVPSFATISESSTMGEFWIHRSGLRQGPFSLAELKDQAAHWQILPEDEIEIVANGDRISGSEWMKIARMLEKNPQLCHAESTVIITRESVLAKERVVRFSEVQEVELILPDPRQAIITNPTGRIIVWTLGVLLCWTLVAPLVAWLLTRRGLSVKRLGMVHGILLKVASGDHMLILDGLGVLAPDSPRRAHLEKMVTLVRSLVEQARA